MSFLISSFKWMEDAATVVTASSEVATFEAANLLDVRPSLKWRSTSLTPSLIVNLGTPRPVRIVSLLYTNGIAADTKRVYGATSEANLTAAPGYDSTSLSLIPAGADVTAFAEPHSRLLLSSAKNFQWWKIDINASTHTDGFFQAAGLLIGERDVENEVGAGYGWTITDEERGAGVVQDYGGEEVTRPGTVKAALQLELPRLTKTESFGQMRRLMRARGQSGQVYIAIDDAESTYAQDFMLVGTMSEPVALLNPFFQKWAVQLTVREI